MMTKLLKYVWFGWGAINSTIAAQVAALLASKCNGAAVLYLNEYAELMTKVAENQRLLRDDEITLADVML